MIDSPERGQPRPVILAVDDEPNVLSAIYRDLRQRYGGSYRIVRDTSGRAALETLRQLKLRGEPVALILTDQRMPEMTGVDLLAEALQIFPDARRALLTAYADTEVAIRAINEINLDHYLQKPWDPPAERLYPVVDELLDDWQASYRREFGGLRLIGHRWSAAAHAIKELLSRNFVPYRWMDIETDEDAARVLDVAGLGADSLPVVVFPDGSYLERPSSATLVERIGLQTRAQMPFYDLIIVGAGPAGLAAAVYSASEGLKTLLIEREAPGGQAGTSSRIENYLGFPKGLSGEDLTRRAVAQAKRLGAELLAPQEVIGLEIADPYRVVTLRDGSQLSCHALLIATGVTYRRLDVPGIDRLTGAGVYYGSASTEAGACSARDIFIVGGGNSAGQAAMYLSGYARTVNILVRRTDLSATMSRYLIDQIASTPNIRVRPCSSVTEVIGAAHLEAVTIADATTGDLQTCPAAALFIFIGARPHTEWVPEAVQRDSHGFLLAGVDLMSRGDPPAGWPLRRDPFWLETSVPGVLVAGDVRARSIKRVASAVGEGAMAVTFVHQHLADL